MALTSDQITAQNFADFYNTIKPYLNGGGFKMTKLWENSDPTSAMSANTDIDLSSSDYDMLLMMYKYMNSVDYCDVCIIPKGLSAQLTSGNQSIVTRRIKRLSDTKYQSENGYDGSSVSNNHLIPYQIYGIKLYAYDNISCVMMSSTWEAGQTTVTFTDPIIDGDSIFDVYLPSQYADLIYSSLSVSGHTLTITFPSAQASDIEVKLRVNRG